MLFLAFRSEMFHAHYPGKSKEKNPHLIFNLESGWESGILIS